MTTLTRSTNAISDFVRAARRSVAAAKLLEDAENDMKALANAVLQQIGDGRTVKVDGVLATLTPRIKESISRTCDDVTAVAWFKEHGLPTDTRSSEYVPPATFTAAVKAGSVDERLYKVTTKIDVNVK